MISQQSLSDDMLMIQQSLSDEMLMSLDDSTFAFKLPLSFNGMDSGLLLLLVLLEVCLMLLPLLLLPLSSLDTISIELVVTAVMNVGDRLVARTLLLFTADGNNPLLLLIVLLDSDSGC